MKRATILLLCAALFLTALPGAFAEGDPALDQAFSSGSSLRLAKADLPIIGILYGWMPLSLAPDGETMLWAGQDGLYLTRNGQITPVKAAPERGAGDPYGKLEKYMPTITRMIPAEEGVCWSPDGRYALLTNKRQMLQNMRSLDLMLLDTQTGEMFLAAAFSDKIRDENAGFIYEAKFDRSGRYVFFTGRIPSISLFDSLFRFDMDTGEIEHVNECLYATISPSLFETAEGDWLVLASREGGGRGPETLYRCSSQVPDETMQALYKLVGGQYPHLGTDGRAYSRQLPASLIRTERMVYSADSGYGLMKVDSPSSQFLPQYTKDISETAAAASAFPQAFVKMLRLNRITPDGAEMDQYWYLMDDSPDLSQVSIRQADADALRWLRAAANDRTPALTEEEDAALGALARDLLMSRVLYVSAAALSPDGHYAMLNAGFEQTWGLFLLRLDDMELRPVSAPEGLASNAVGTQLGQQFRPGIVWNPDGTLLIYNGTTRKTEAYRLDLR